MSAEAIDPVDALLNEFELAVRDDYGGPVSARFKKAHAALRTALASRAQQEPVAWMVEWRSLNGGPWEEISVKKSEAEARALTESLEQYRAESRVVPLVIGAEPAQPKPRHVCGARGFADSGDTCPACAEGV